MIVTAVTIAAAGSIPPVAAMTSARLASAEVGSLALAMLTPAKRHDERGRV
jgi:hypothetical protein